MPLYIIASPYFKLAGHFEFGGTERKKKVLVQELANQFEELADSEFLKSKATNINVPDSYVNRIVHCLNYWIANSQTVLAKKELNDFLANPTRQNGSIYEILGYQWFQKNGIPVEYQPELNKEDCLKAKSGYKADGRLDGEIIFDIKSFSFGQSQYPILENALNEMWQKERKRRIQECKARDCEKGSAIKKAEEDPDYCIMISGEVDLSSQKMGELLAKKQDIYTKLFSEANKFFTDFIYRLVDCDLEIRAHYNKLGRVNFHTSISEFNVDKWAMMNETQVLSHCSQFCRNHPYFLIYPYDREKARYLSFDDLSLFYALRTLMRRSFINLRKDEQNINCYDGKAVNDMKVCEAIGKLSGVFFLDVTEEYQYNKTNAILYLNPNADNPMKSSQVEFFRISGVTVYDFFYDNY